MVNGEGETVFDAFVKPEKEVVSCITALTGLTIEDISSASPLESVLCDLKKVLPSDAVLVGQGIGHDIMWCKLEEGKDFRASVDIADMFKVRLKNHNGLRDADGVEVTPRFKHYSLRHCCLVLLEVDMQKNENSHDPVLDAKYSVMLFNRYRGKEQNEMKFVRDSLSRTSATDSFSIKYPVVDGVAMSKDGTRVMIMGQRICRWWKAISGKA